MLKSVFKYATLFATTITSLCTADCQTTFELGLGYRSDSTQWDVNTIDLTNGTESDTKLRFKDQNIFLINAKTVMIEDWFYFRANADYGWLCSGKLQQHFGVLPQGREEVITSSHGKIKSGSNVADVTAVVGYPFEFCCGDFILAPLVGYTYHYQRYKLHNRFIDDVVVNSSSSSFEGSNFENSVRWYGPTIGFDAFWRMDDCWNLWGEFDFTFAKCKRKGENNTGVIALDSHSKSNNAFGFDGSVGADYFFSCDWYAGLSVDFKYWKTKKSHPREYVESEVATLLPSDNDNNFGDTLRWTSVGFTVDIGYLF